MLSNIEQQESHCTISSKSFKDCLKEWSIIVSSVIASTMLVSIIILVCFKLLRNREAAYYPPFIDQVPETTEWKIFNSYPTMCYFSDLNPNVVDLNDVEQSILTQILAKHRVQEEYTCKQQQGIDELDESMTSIYNRHKNPIQSSEIRECGSFDRNGNFIYDLNYGPGGGRERIPSRLTPIEKHFMRQYNGYHSDKCKEYMYYKHQKTIEEQAGRSPTDQKIKLSRFTNCGPKNISEMRNIENILTLETDDWNIGDIIVAPCGQLQHATKYKDQYLNCNGLCPVCRHGDNPRGWTVVDD